MDILATIWTVTFGVLLVILGLNALIIVHEIGHFIVARWNGVRCEKFYIWFDFWGLKFFKFKWGDTEYGLGLFPLGGYVKMLGQEDNPGAIQAEIERAKLQTETGGLTHDIGGLSPPALEATQSSALFAPDSYLSKTVPQRLAIIVAGVIMNFLFAIVCAAGAYMIGVKVEYPAVGSVIPGSPAWQSGLQPGDRIIDIEGSPSQDFRDINRTMIAVTMVKGDDETVKRAIKPVQLTIERQKETMEINVSPRKRGRDLHPYIGILPLPSLELAPLRVPSHWEKFFDTASLAVLNNDPKGNPLRLEKVDGETVDNYVEYQEAQLKKIGLPITCTFNGVDTTIPAIPMREIPVRFKMGEIVCVLPGSDAENKGVKKGDTLVSVDGNAEIDPLKLPQVLLRKVNEGHKSVEVVVKKTNGTEQQLTLELKPTRLIPELTGISTTRDPLASNALGLAWSVVPVIAEVKGYESQAGQPLPAIGDRVTEVELVNCPAFLPKTSFVERKNTELSREKGSFFLLDKVTYEKGLAFHSVGDKVDIPYIFTFLLQEAKPIKHQTYTYYFKNITEQSQKDDQANEQEETRLLVRLTLESPDKTIKIVEMPIVESTDWYNTERGFVLMPELNTFKAVGLGDALYRGTLKTIDYSFLIYKSLQSLLNGTVSPRALNGPVGIVKFIYQVAQMDWSAYLMLLCLIGANLAVINILPIPPLDGGHVLFLTYEGIFRRQPNELIQVILSYVGLFLILLLMVWTVALDITCIPRW